MFVLRAKKALLNTTVGFAHEMVTVICSFILPRLILTTFGSKYNGLASAIGQFLGAISLFQAGIGGVTYAALYKPLSEGNREKISTIVKTTETFLMKVAMVFLVFSLLIACVYPYFVRDEFDWFFTFSLVIIMSVSTFAQYFFGLAYSFLLNADQKQSFTYAVNIVKTIINTIVAIILIKCGFGIREVRLGSAIVFVLAPLFINWYAKRKYSLIKNVKVDNSQISQRWDNFGQQVAYFVHSNTDLVIISVFLNVYEVSVYAVYNMVIHGVKGIFNPIVKGIGAAFGNMFANDELDLVKKNLLVFEEVVFSVSTFLFGVTAATIVPFVMLYTKGVTDINYSRYTFAFIMSVATMIHCYRYPYQTLVNAKGHFKENRNGAFFEAFLNVGCSVLLVNRLGIIGVAVGTLISMIFRTCQYSWYLSKVILNRSMTFFIKRICLSSVSFALILIVSVIMPLKVPLGYSAWVLNAALISVMALIIALSVELIFYRKDLLRFVNILKGALVRKKKGT